MKPRLSPNQQILYRNSIWRVKELDPMRDDLRIREVLGDRDVWVNRRKLEASCVIVGRLTKRG